MMLDFGLYNMDCMQGMREFPDQYFDLAICDPPYGINADGGTNGFGHAKARNYSSKWDSKPPDAEYFAELRRVSKNQIIFGAQYMINHLTAGTKWVVWDKVGEAKFKNPFSKCELAWTSFNGVVDKIVCYQMGFVSSEKHRIHPTQKPVELYEWLLLNYAKDGDIILDTHAGSASSLIACRNTDHNYVGFELDEYYYKLAKKRLDDATAQMNIFDFMAEGANN